MADKQKEITADISQETRSPNPFRILVAEDDDEMRIMLVQALRSAGYKVVEVPSGIELLDYFNYLLVRGPCGKKISLIISDIRMPGFTGLEILQGMRHYKGFPPMILITAFGDEMTHAEAKRSGAAVVFDKPFDVNDLIAKVNEIIPAGK